ncbi:hypothetical protein GA0115240_12265, partial [Streptomyces sp. DvalAA-14]
MREWVPLPTAILTGPANGAPPPSPLTDDLRALGFQVVRAATPAEAAARLAAVPAADRVAVVDPRFLGHRHALRLALTDPRFDAAAIPGALSVQPPARPALARALESEAAGSAGPAGRSGRIGGVGEVGGVGPASLSGHGPATAPTAPTASASPTTSASPHHPLPA